MSKRILIVEDNEMNRDVLSRRLQRQGYLVLLPNPRGDWSYGLPYRDAIYGDYGPGPFADVIGGVSALIHRGLVDSTAVGVYGGSYGAYLTAYAITQTRRFAAAVMDDGMVNLTSFYGQTYATSAPALTSSRARGRPSATCRGWTWYCGAAAGSGARRRGRRYRRPGS